MTRRCLPPFLIMLLIPFGSAAQYADESLTLQGVIGEDVYAAGPRVQVNAEVDGDVLVAGGRVLVEYRVTGDVMAAGGSVAVRGEVLDDVRTAGGEVTIDAQIGDQLLAAGGSVLLAPGARVAGKAWLAGGEIELAGEVGGTLKAGGGTVIISGTVLGDAEITAHELRVLPGAQIAGKLLYRSEREAEISAEAQVGGGITREEMPAIHQRREAPATALRIMGLLSLLAAGLTLIALFPGFSAAAARTVGAQPWQSLGLGLALLVTTPVAALVLLASGIGALLALLVLAAYLILLVAGYLTGVLFLADAALQRLRPAAQHTGKPRLLAFALALLALSAAQLIPLAGGLLSAALLLFGIGALQLAAYRRYRTAPG